MLKDLVLKTRTFRRFYQDAIDRKTLEELVDLARFSASTSNCQPLKYYISYEPDKNALIFPLIYMARPNKEVRHPPEGELPTAYIIILGDKEITETFTPDYGVAAQTIKLGAMEKGIGGCTVGMIRREQLMELLRIPERYQILLVIVLGKPKEEVRLETVGQDGSINFYWDEAGVFHVPKRSLDDIIVASHVPNGKPLDKFQMTK